MSVKEALVRGFHYLAFFCNGLVSWKSGTLQHLADALARKTQLALSQEKSAAQALDKPVDITASSGT
jgi:hypothetical protein